MGLCVTGFHLFWVKYTDGGGTPSMIDFPADWPEPHRPPAVARWIGTRADPVRFGVRTRFLYSGTTVTSRGTLPALRPGGAARHAFSRAGTVPHSEVPATSGLGDSPVDHLWRAIAAFGDDADLVVVVRRSTRTPPSQEAQDR